MSNDRDGDYFRRRQARAVPTEDLKPYWGKWIAVRDREIVASGPAWPRFGIGTMSYRQTWSCPFRSPKATSSF